ncbi:MAG: Hsp20/alpha crystallin family protein [Phycisphaeraceae bacterium]|nr:Hsp20/alpha crystallin family protein [Phycisphaeraceae bacterium]
MINRLQKVWDSPFDLLRDVDRAIGNRVGIANDGLTARYPVDIHEDEDGLTVSAELPGFTKEQVDISIDNGVLAIGAQRKSTKQDEATTHLHERRFTRVCRQFTLPTSVDTTDVDAALADGVLTLRIRKKEEVKPRKIEVK